MRQLKKLRVKGRQASWVTEGFIAEMRKCDYLKKKASKSKCIADWNVFKKQRNRVNRWNKTLKDEHFVNKLRSEEKDPKKVWKTLKQLIPDSNSEGDVNHLRVDGNDVSNPVDIANNFNSSFASVKASLASKFNCNSTENICPKVSSKDFRSAPTHHCEVLKLINSLETDEATGNAGIGVRLLKAGNPVLSNAVQ